MKNNSAPSSAEKSARKPHRRFNFIDFLLILFVLAIILTAINIVSPRSIIDNFKADTSHTILYTVEITGVSNEFADKIKENDTVLDSVSKSELGYVETVYTTQYSTLEYNEADQKGELSVHVDKCNIIVTIKAESSYLEGKGYSVNDKRIAIGEKFSLRFPDYIGEGYCINLSEES